MTITESRWNDLDDYRDFLEHYGIKGMKWGVRKERKTSGTKRKKRTFSDKQQARRSQRAKNRVARAKARSEKQAEEAKRKAEKAAAKKEKRRQAILNNPTQLYKHRREFSQQEIQQAMQQFDWERRLNSYSRDQLNNGAEFINTMFKYVNNATNLYNAAARISNSLGDTNLPIIKTTKDLEDKNKNKKQKSD